MSVAKTTTNHQEIQQWVESRGGRPARVKATGRRGDMGILRIDYPGFSGEESLEQISWPEWFETFDKSHLAFLYQEKVRGGSPSRFSKLVARGNKSATGRRGGAAKRTAAKRPSAKRSSRTKRSTGTKRTTAPKRKATAAKRGTATKRPATARRSSGTKRSSQRSSSTTRKTARAGAPRTSRRPSSPKKRGGKISRQSGGRSARG